MGINNFVSTVLTKYRADPSQHIAAIKKTEGVEKKRHEALLAQTEAQNKKLDAHIATWTKVAIGIGAATAAAAVLSKGLDTLQHNVALRGATVGVSIDGLTKATNNLVEKTRLLEFSAAAMNGTFKLSQKEMENALQGALALRKEGKDLATTMDRIQSAVTEGSTEPLKNLGLVLKGADNDTQAGLNAAMAMLNDEAAKMGGNFSQSGDNIVEASVEMKNSMDDLMESLGKLATAFGPVISAMAQIVGMMADVVGNAMWLFSQDDRDGTDANRMGKQHAELMAKARRQSMGAGAVELGLGGGTRGTRGSMTSGGANEAFMMRPIRSGFDFDATDDDQAIGPWFDPHVQGRRKKGSGSRAAAFTSNAPGIDVVGGMRSIVTGLGGAAAGFRDRQLAAREQEAGIDEEDRLATIEAIEKASELAALTRDMEDSVLSTIFGTPAEIDAQTTSLIMMSSAFDGLASAFGAGVDALITGSDSFANAFKTAISESLRSMAVEMSISALKHTAYGLASVAFMDGRGAAAHFAAAAQFGAGALAAGVGARALGAGGSQAAQGGTRTAGSAGVGSARGGDSGGRGSTNVFIVGNDFEGMNHRAREAMWRETSRRAGVSIEGDVAIDG